MTSANPDDPTRDANAGATPTASPSDETTGELELLEVTPTPVVLPLPPGEVVPPPPASAKRPPPLPPQAALRTTQSRPVVPPPPPPGAALEDPPSKRQSVSVGATARTSSLHSTVAARLASTAPTQRMPSPLAAPRAPSPSPDAPPTRPSQSRPSVAAPPAGRRAPSSDSLPAAVPAVGASLPPAASAARSSASHAVVSPPPPPPAPPTLTAQMLPLPPVSAAKPYAAESEHLSLDAAVADARKRVEHATAGERTALARARIELGLLLEIAGKDPTSALNEYRAAHNVATHLTAPVTAARRLVPLRPVAPLLVLVEAEARATSAPAARAIRQLELGWLLAGSSAPAERTAQAFREVLAALPGHPGALRGLETALGAAPRTAETTQQMEALATHLEAMAQALRSDGQLPAWLEVERGQLLEKLGRADAARAAFEAALALDGRIGPVRDAYTRHLLVQNQSEALIEAFSAEAALETDGARAARLLYAAGRLAAERLEQKVQAIALYERAASSDGATPSLTRAALRELLPLYLALGNLDLAATTCGRMLAVARDAERAYCHRRLVAICEALGRFADMAAHAHQVLSSEPDDEPMRAKLDHALAALGRHADRVAMLTEQATHASTTAAQVELLLRAARIAEQDMARPDLALLSLRSAWAVETGNAETGDAIVRLLTPGTPPSPDAADDPSRVRARIDFYVEAAAAAREPARKIAYLEKLALLWEDEVRAPDRAMAVFAEILTLEPRRRSAILGLARCAGRAGNARELVRALVLEADQSGTDVALERSLLLRAADVASQRLGEHDAALDLIQRVLARTAGEPAALRAAFRIHARAGRQAEALAQLRLLLSPEKSAADYPVQAEIARFLEERMHRTADALAGWREAHAMAPANPTPRAEICRILLLAGDHRAVAEELVALAAATPQPTERGELLLEAAEIYDDRLGDLERAVPLLVDARACLPDEAAITERLDRAYLRTHRKSERLALLFATESPHPRCQLAIASLLAEDRDPTKASKRLFELASDETAGTAALRILEHVLRRAERWSEWNALLRLQIQSFATREAKLGSVYELVALEEYGEGHTPDGQPAARELLAGLAPDDLLHHEILIRRSGLAPEGATPATALCEALTTVAAAAPDPLAAAALHLAAALRLERSDEGNPDAEKQALLSYVTVLEGWPDCLTAARGARRMAQRLGETRTLIEMATALGSVELDPALRSERLLEAAQAQASLTHDAVEPSALACQALLEDPNSVRAADAVIAAIGGGLDAGKAGETLRTALDRTTVPDQAARLGAALAHVAVAYLNDQTMALEALRRARKRAPKHTGTLLSLAEVSNALGLHAEAVEAATAALGQSREPALRLRAGIALAEVHVRTPAFRDTARREANEAEKLAEQAGANSGDLIGRLGAVYRQLGDEASAERVLVSALALGSEDSAALDNLITMYGTNVEAGERIATALHRVIANAKTTEQPLRPEWLAALGKVEVAMLRQRRDGLAHLREAAVLAPGRVATYQALVDAHGNAHDDAARDLVDMLPAFGRAATSAAHIASMLSLLARECQRGQRPGIAQATLELLALIKRSTGSEAEAAAPPALPASACVPGSLLRKAIVSSLLPDVEQAPLLDAAALLWEPLAKLVREEPEALGLSPRDRLTARSPHPVRVLADRIARAFGELRFDLYLDARKAGPGRVLAGEPAALVLPPGFGERPEREQAAILARLLCYVALDVPWLEELSVGETDGVLFGGLRAGMELWGHGELSPSAEKSASAWRPRIAKLAGRKLKRTLDESGRRIRAQADTSAWRQAVRIAALRAAYVLSGDLQATLNPSSALDAELVTAKGASLTAKLFAKPLTREVVVFALSDAAQDLRQTCGTG
jgi:cellulose synthase operon protein C